jgi:hypothetical protein
MDETPTNRSSQTGRGRYQGVHSPVKRPTIAYIGGPLDGKEFKKVPLKEPDPFCFVFKCGCIEFGEDELAPEHDHPCIAIYEFEDVISTEKRWVYVCRQENPISDLLEVHDEVPGELVIA